MRKTNKAPIDYRAANEQRAERGAQVAGFYCLKWGEAQNDQTNLVDMLADLMHFAYSQREAEDCPMNFDDALFTAQMHFDAEQRGEP